MAEPGTRFESLLLVNPTVSINAVLRLLSYLAIEGVCSDKTRGRVGNFSGGELVTKAPDSAYMPETLNILAWPGMLFLVSLRRPASIISYCSTWSLTKCCYI